MDDATRFAQAAKTNVADPEKLGRLVAAQGAKWVSDSARNAVFGYALHKSGVLAPVEQ